MLHLVCLLGDFRADGADALQGVRVLFDYQASRATCIMGNDTQCFQYETAITSPNDLNIRKIISTRARLISRRIVSLLTQLTVDL